MKKLFSTLVILLFTNFCVGQISITFTNVVQPCTNNGSATAVVTGGTAPYTYSWVQLSYFPFSSSTVSTSSVITNAIPAFYYLTVTDFNNAQATDTLFLPGTVHFMNDTMGTSIFPYTGITAAAVCPSPNSALTYTIAGGSAPYTYSLNAGSPQNTSSNTFSFNSVPVGNYTCTVTDNNGCFASCYGRVYASSGFNVYPVSTPDTCTGNGTATAIISGGGTAPFSYLWNTSPPQYTQTITGLTADWTNNGSLYQVTVTDANGCVTQNDAWVRDSITAYSMQSFANIGNAICGQTNGFVAISNSGGTPPYTYQWSTGATTDSIYNLPAGTYSVIVSDAAGCHEEFLKFVASVSPVSVYDIVTNANCNNTGGADTAIVNGGTPPYTYQWSNGATTPNISNLSAGWYNVIVTDANNCQGGTMDSVSLQPNCIAYINGTVYNDMNGNCALDFNESILPQQIFQASNGFMYWSDWNGNFSIPIINPSGTYTVSQTPKIPWVQICPASPISVNAIGGNTYGTYYYYDKPTPLVNDLQVYITTDSCRPGFTFNQWVTVFNNGTSTMTGTATLQHDALLNVISSGTASSYNSGTHTFSYSFVNLPPMEWTSFYVQLQAPSSTPLFTPLNSYAVANPVSGDATPNDNYDTLHYRVTGSYDPNEKTVVPKGTGPNGNISTTDSVLTYNIHFQNTGTYPTTFVSLIDTIDSNLDIFSIKIVNSVVGVQSWQPSVSFLNNNVIKFSYSYCQLQPASADILNSSGYITYTIKQKKNLSIGTQIKNRADIYFDYNTAILTNTTLNTINALAGINNIANKQRDILIYPNPTSNILNVVCKTKSATPTPVGIKVFDMLGNLVKQQNSENEITTIDMSNFQNGVYFIEIKTNEGISTMKFVVQR